MPTFAKSILPAFALALAIANPASAAPTELQSSPMIHEGKQVGCQFTFGHSQADPANFKTGEALVEGSMSFMMFDKKIIFALKSICTSVMSAMICQVLYAGVSGALIALTAYFAFSLTNKIWNRQLIGRQ